jgi:uncharacterized membrane protein
MNATALFLAFSIGFVAGLRSMTAPAAVCWGARLGWLHIEGTALAWMGSAWAVGIFTIGALAEFVADQLPKTPARTAAGPLVARIVTGGLSGACVCASAGQNVWLGAVLGGAGAIAGAFAGYRVRTGLVRSLRVPDFLIAIPEDLIAIGIGLFAVSRW